MSTESASSAPNANQPADLAIAEQARSRLQWGVLAVLLILAVQAARFIAWIRLEFANAAPFANSSEQSFFSSGLLIGIFELLFFVYVPYQLIFPFVTFVAALAHQLFGGKSDWNSWINATYQALWAFPFAALAGAILVILDYFVGVHFLVPIIVGNLAGASVYVPILLAWYQIRRQESTISIQQ